MGKTKLYMPSWPQYVYRVQDDEGRGPWRPGFSHKWVEDRSDHGNLKPWFQEFTLKGSVAPWEHSGCGCETLDQLRRWFTGGEYAKLVEFGYNAVKVKASRILGKSEIQCVFTTLKPLTEIEATVALYPMERKP